MKKQSLIYSGLGSNPALRGASRHAPCSVFVGLTSGCEASTSGLIEGQGLRSYASSEAGGIGQ